MMLQSERYKIFPQLADTVYGKPLVYLDNAATTLRPVAVIEKWDNLAEHLTSNIHRAVHRTATLATDEFENTRAAVQKFINAKNSAEIVFTSGDTQSINLVAFSFGERFIKEGDEVIVCEAEHHSNIVPWQLVCSRNGALLKTFRVDESGHIDLQSLSDAINSRTKIVCVAHISNVLGIVNPIAEIVGICHSRNVPVLVDGAQGIAHEKVDVQQLDCDFYTFSGHKMYAVPGTGVLYGKMQWLEQMPPYMSGGEMIGTVNWNETTFAPVPHKFEAGTQNFTGIPTLVPAIDTVEAFREAAADTATEMGRRQGGGVSEVSEEGRLRSYLLSELHSIDGLRIYGDSESDDKIPLFSFTVSGAHHEDLALILDKMGIAVRSGQMCAEPLMNRYGVTGMLRASFAPYNTMEEAEYFITSLHKAIKMLK